MPRGDRTGPTGAGPRTGRGRGSCKASSKPTSFKSRKTRIGRGLGRRRGRG